MAVKSKKAKVKKLMRRHGCFEAERITALIDYEIRRDELKKEGYKYIGDIKHRINWHNLYNRLLSIRLMYARLNR